MAVDDLIASLLHVDTLEVARGDPSTDMTAAS